MTIKPHMIPLHASHILPVSPAASDIARSLYLSTCSVFGLELTIHHASARHIFSFHWYQGPPIIAGRKLYEREFVQPISSEIGCCKATYRFCCFDGRAFFSRRFCLSRRCFRTSSALRNSLFTGRVALPTIMSEVDLSDNLFFFF